MMTVQNNRRRARSEGAPRPRLAEKGFTLIEMIIVVGMIALISTVVIANTRSITNNTKVKAAAGTLLDTAKDTRSNSVAVREFGSDQFPSYGIHVELASPSEVTVFADCIADDSGDEWIDDRDVFRFIDGSNQCSGSDGMVETVPFPSGIQIRSIEATFPSGAGMTTEEQSRVDILFLRPEPTIWITLDDNTLLPAGKVTVIVGDMTNEYERRVTFYSTGEFFVE